MHDLPQTLCRLSPITRLNSILQSHFDSVHPEHAEHVSVAEDGSYAADVVLTLREKCNFERPLAETRYTAEYRNKQGESGWIPTKGEKDKGGFARYTWPIEPAEAELIVSGFNMEHGGKVARVVIGKCDEWLRKSAVSSRSGGASHSSAVVESQRAVTTVAPKRQRRSSPASTKPRPAMSTPVPPPCAPAGGDARSIVGNGR